MVVNIIKTYIYDKRFGQAPKKAFLSIYSTTTFLVKAGKMLCFVNLEELAQNHTTITNHLSL